MSDMLDKNLKELTKLRELDDISEYHGKWKIHWLYFDGTCGDSYGTFDTEEQAKETADMHVFANPNLEIISHQQIPST